MITEVQNAKTVMRAEVRGRLGQVSAEARGVASALLCAALLRQRIWQEATSVLLFAPMPKEPDVWPLVAEAIRCGKSVALPRFVSDTENYTACRVQRQMNDIQVGKFGIREPNSSCVEMALNLLDLVLVPGVAFDAHGRRLGRGKGYYDRLLAGVGGIKCGIAFDEQIVAEVPAGPHDVHLNCILTPTRWIET